MRSKNNVHLFAASFVATLITFRAFLHFYPSANFSIGIYNIHHLFTGTIILIFSTLLLVNRINNKFVIMMSGIGSALIADQIIYLIATDGSDKAYLTTISLNGAIFLGILIIITLYVINLFKRK
ncbi:MAG TPA: hypothetical protein VJI97_02570 [Candidatus Nanoarchaeia archaeon]|nr:hypothetical protein [Candidatus Nanoarchaeia archaeon]